MLERHSSAGAALAEPVASESWCQMDSRRHNIARSTLAQHGSFLKSTGSPARAILLPRDPIVPHVRALTVLGKTRPAMPGRQWARRLLCERLARPAQLAR